jgi:DNA-binding transcriptional ArsR family regulator
VTASPARTEAGAAALDALADPTRRRILELLADGEQTVATVVAGLGAERRISQPAVSQHLRRLLDAGLVRVRSVGRTRRYALEPTGIVAAGAWLEALVAGPRPFAQPLDALATEVARGRRQRRRSATTAVDADVG